VIGVRPTQNAFGVLFLIIVIISLLIVVFLVLSLVVFVFFILFIFDLVIVLVGLFFAGIQRSAEIFGQIVGVLVFGLVSTRSPIVEEFANLDAEVIDGFGIVALGCALLGFFVVGFQEEGAKGSPKAEDR
jgi:hypothetical protein